MTNLRAAGAILFEQRIGIADADPNPCSEMSLIALAQEDVGASARDRGDDARLAPVQLEAEDAHVVVDARFKIADAKNRIDTFEFDSHAAGL